MVIMSIRNAQLKCKSIGYTLKHNDGEFSVYPVGCPDKAYYTDDIRDAVGTAQAMAKERRALLSAKRNIITLKLINGVWFAVYTGEHADTIKALFGSDTISTPYTALAPSGVVCGLIQQRNPDALVLIN